jgi:transposase
LGVEVAKSEQWQCIPTRLSIEQFQQFVLPHLSIGSRGPAPKLTLHAVFNYILQSLYLGCQWKELPIEKDQEGRPEIHYTRIYGAFRRWQADGCFEAVFAGSVLKLHQANLLDTTVIHGDGTTTAAKKGGDNIGFSGHKKVKGDKIVAFCDRHCNVIAPFVSAPGNRNESPLLREALPLVTRIANAVGLDLQGTIVSLDGVYDCRTNRKAISIVEWFPISTRILAVEKSPNEAASRSSTPPFSKNGSIPSSACSVGKISSGDYCCDLNGSVSYTTHLKPWPIR